MENFVAEWKEDPFVGCMVNFVHRTFRGETLGADLTRQKRGPRTSIWMRLRGRLPILQALPRRASLATVGPYMDKLITLFLSMSVATQSRRWERVNLLTVDIVLARPPRGGSMAMAMALMLATTPDAFGTAKAMPRNGVEAQLRRGVGPQTTEKTSYARFEATASLARAQMVRDAPQRNLALTSPWPPWHGRA
jgi:hypothetical protein